MKNALSVIELRDSLFRGLLLASEARRSEGRSHRTGADWSDADTFLREAFQSFDSAARDEALLMSRLYALIYCFEKSVRDLIRDRLADRHGTKWWETRIPPGVREFTESGAAAGHEMDLLGFVPFEQLYKIFVSNWTDFSDLLPSQQWLKHRIDELEITRTDLARNRLLHAAEYQRIHTSVAEWNRVVGGMTTSSPATFPVAAATVG
jgi:HEPN superfamily Swt1-like protein